MGLGGFLGLQDLKGLHEPERLTHFIQAPKPRVSASVRTREGGW